MKKLLCVLFWLSASVYCMEEFNKIPKKPISLEAHVDDGEEASINNFIENENEFSSADIENIKKLSLDELKMLSAAALLKKSPEQKGGGWGMPIRKLAQFAYPSEQRNQKTGMSESYLTFIREPTSSINPYSDIRDDEITDEKYFSLDFQMQALFKKIQFLVDKEKMTKND